MGVRERGITTMEPIVEFIEEEEFDLDILAKSAKKKKSPKKKKAKKAKKAKKKTKKPAKASRVKGSKNYKKGAHESKKLNNGRNIKADAKLAGVTKAGTFNMFKLFGLLNKHIK